MILKNFSSSCGFFLVCVATTRWTFLAGEVHIELILMELRIERSFKNFLSIHHGVLGI